MGIKYSGQDVEVEVYNTKDGRWAIDKETGKELMHIKLIDKNSKRVLDYVPSHTDVYEIVKKLLDAEKYNDSYEFKNPKMDKHRKPQLPQKLDKIRDIIMRYSNDGGNMGQHVKRYLYSKEPGAVSEQESLDMWYEREKRSAKLSAKKTKEMDGEE
jgi:hypothetical protein